MSMVKKSSDMTRVDQIRARRTGDEKPRKATRPVVGERPKTIRGASAPVEKPKTAARRPYAPAPPPVITRSGYAIPVGQKSAGQKSRGKVRRQFYYNLGATGAEVRLPSLPSIALGWRAVSGAISLLLVGAVFLLWNAPQFQIVSARVMGAQRISADEVLTALDVEGLPIIEVDPAGMTNTLKAVFPELSEVQVSIGLPARVVVTVTERIPLLAWEQDGEIQWIDKDGYAFTPRGDAGVDLIWIKAGGAPDKPVVDAGLEDAEASANAGETPIEIPGLASLLTPKPAEQFVSTELIEAIQALKPQTPEGQSIAYDPSYGLGWTDPQGWVVYFGKSLADMDLKLAQYQTIIAELPNRGITPSLISVEYLHAPFIRSEQ